MDDSENLPDSVPVTDGALHALAKTRGWVSFLGVVAIIGAVLCAVAFLGGLGFLAAHGRAGATLIIEAVIALVIAILFATFWLRYSGILKRISSAGENLDAMLEEALIRQRKLWVLQGVVILIMIAISVIAAVAAPLLGLR